MPKVFENQGAFRSEALHNKKGKIIQCEKNGRTYCLVQRKEESYSKVKAFFKAVGFTFAAIFTFGAFKTIRNGLANNWKSTFSGARVVKYFRPLIAERQGDDNNFDSQMQAQRVSAIAQGQQLPQETFGIQPDPDPQHRAPVPQQPINPLPQRASESQQPIKPASQQRVPILATSEKQGSASQSDLDYSYNAQYYEGRDTFEEGVLQSLPRANYFCVSTSTQRMPFEKLWEVPAFKEYCNKVKGNGLPVVILVLSGLELNRPIANPPTDVGLPKYSTLYLKTGQHDKVYLRDNQKQINNFRENQRIFPARSPAEIPQQRVPEAPKKPLNPAPQQSASQKNLDYSYNAQYYEGRDTFEEGVLRSLPPANYFCVSASSPRMPFERLWEVPKFKEYCNNVKGNGLPVVILILCHLELDDVEIDNPPTDVGLPKYSTLALKVGRGDKVYLRDNQEHIDNLREELAK